MVRVNIESTTNCFVPECTITAVWQTSYNHLERCEICWVESNDGLHVPWRSEYITGPAGRTAESGRVPADQGSVGQQTLEATVAPCARHCTPAQSTLTTTTGLSIYFCNPVTTFFIQLYYEYCFEPSGKEFWLIITVDLILTNCWSQ